MRSMTGFGTGLAEGDRFRVTVTLRAVNHRYLDIVLRLRDEQRPIERRLRDLLTGSLERGRVEVSLEIESIGARAVRVEVDRDLVREVRTQLDVLAGLGLLSAELGVSELLRIPDALRIETEEAEWCDDDAELLLSAARGALEQLVAAREEEGRHLRRILGERLALLEQVHGELAERAAELPEQIARALAERIEQMLGDTPKPDDVRLAQEVAILVDRTDVREELDRLATHLDHFRTLADRDGSIGKRLDFLAQEIFRELNTIGSKCRDADLVQKVLEGKTLCEQLREQAQNVE